MSVKRCDQPMPAIRRTSSTHGGSRSSHTIENLTSDEANAFDGFLTGACWARVEKGRLHVRPIHEPIPDPIADPFFGENWQRPRNNAPAKFNLQDFDKPGDHCSPSFIIQHLCGYGFTRERYKAQARRLESYGFECLRSRRGTNGRYWELWYLPGLWCAEGELKKAVGTHAANEWNAATKRATNFLTDRESFGTLDVCIQRAAMVVD